MQNFRNRFAYWGVYALLFQFGQGILLAVFLGVGEMTWSWKLFLALFSFPAMALAAAAHPGVFEFAKKDSTGANAFSCVFALCVGIIIGTVAMVTGAHVVAFATSALVVTALVLLAGVIVDSFAYRAKNGESMFDLFAHTGLSMAIGIFALGGPLYGAVMLIIMHVCAAGMYRLRRWSIGSLRRFQPAEATE